MQRQIDWTNTPTLRVVKIIKLVIADNIWKSSSLIKLI
jgi:hypothetical protein